MQTQDFDVGDNKARTLGRCEDLGKRRNIRSGEDVLANERIDRSRRIGVSDRVHERDTVGGQQIAKLAEELVVILLSTCSNMPTDTIRSNWPGSSR